MQNTLFEKTPPTRLVAIVAVPGIISMLVSSLFQVFDGAFVGQLLGLEAFAALNLAMPFVIINFSLADLVGVGSAVSIALKLGEKKDKEANNIFTCACGLIILSAAALGALLFFFAEDLMQLMGASDDIAVMAAQYLRVYAMFAPLTTIFFAVDNYLRVCGKIRYSLAVNILVSLLGIVLEFTFLFLFKMDIGGAALATCVAIIICAAIAFIPFFTGNTQLKFTVPRLSVKILKDIVANGSPSFLNNVSGRITSILMNIFLLRLGGAVAVSAYGVLMYIDGMIQPVLYGLCDSLQPAVGYNWGAGNRGRVRAIQKRCFVICAVMSGVMLAVMMSAKTQVVGIFVQAGDTALMEMSVHAISLFGFAYVTRWVSLSVQSYLSAIGKAGGATLISVSCAFIFPIILMLALAPIGLDGLWLNFPLTELLAAVLSVILLIRMKKRA